MSLWTFVLRPLRHFADFRGRSTRTELIVFHFTAQLIALAADAAGQLGGLPDRTGRLLAITLLACPTMALAVRRLHDSGRSGWWLLLGLPLATVSLWRELLLWGNPFDLSHLYRPWFVELPTALLALCILVLLLWDDEKGPNSYGTNPRDSDDVALSEPPGEPA